MDPWQCDLIVVRESIDPNDRRGAARDSARGLLHRVRPGVDADAGQWREATAQARHVIAVRALAAVASTPPVVSHWSAAILLGLPYLGRHLDRVHVTLPDAAKRGLVGVAGHVASCEWSELVRIGGVLATGPARTAVDIARAGSFTDGVVVTDGALHAGSRWEALHDAALSAAGRRGAARASRVVAFARGEAESPAESISRVTMLRLGIRPPVLQFDVVDSGGLAGRLDFWFPRARAGGEVDGEMKYVELASGDAAGRPGAVIAEKWREDRVRRSVDRFARWGWAEAGDSRRPGPILAAAGVHPADSGARLEDSCRPRLTAAL